MKKSPTLEVIRHIFATSTDREVLEKVAREYRELRHVLKNSLDFTEIDRQAEEIFKQHGV